MVGFKRRLGELCRTASGVLPEFLRRRLAAQGKKSNLAHFEVERKFALSEAEFRALPAKLRERGFRHAGQVYMVDTFIPPAVPGDMIRLRQETENDKTHTVLTLKTWVMVAGSRERQETPDQELSDIVRDSMLEIGARLKGSPLLSFSKDREHYESHTQDGRKVVVALDTTHGLGKYSGHYVEIELLVPQGGDVEAARRDIQNLAQELLGDQRDFVRKSYQDMLMETSA
jgi:adenylate cyclase class IV